jgi:hypothetical protein
VNDEPIPVEEHLTPESRKTRGRIGEDTRKIALITDPEISKDPETSKWLRDYLGNQFEKFGRRWTKLRRIEADTSLPTKAREFARSEIKKWEKRWDLHLPKEGDIGPDGKPLTEDYELGHSEHERDPDTGKIIKEGFPAVEGGSHERSRPIPKSQNVAELKTRWAGQKLEKQYLRGLAKQVEDQLRANRLNEARKTVQRFLQYNIRVEKLFQVFPEWREKLGIL